MLINLQTALTAARQKQIAIGSFNVYNVESLQAAVQAAEQRHSPIIIAFGAAYESHMPLEAMAELVKFYADRTTIPLTLHLDHCRSAQTILRAVKAGFTSVMFDGSSLPLNDNIRQTRKLTDIVHQLNVSLEGEIGYMNAEDGTPAATPDSSCFTTPEEAQRFAAETGVDALAVSVGNAHGIYKQTPNIDLALLRRIGEAAALPLVLHGSSGIPLPTLQQAIRCGIAKININTEISTAGIKTAREFLQTHQEKNTRFEAMTKAAEQTMTAIIKEYISCFNAV